MSLGHLCMLLCLFLGCCQALICLLVSGRWHRLLSVFSLILLSSVARAAFGVGSLFIKQDNQLVLFTLHYIIRQFLLRQGLVPVSTDNSLRSHLSDGQPALPWLVHWALCSLWGAPEGHHGSMCQPPNFRDPDIRPGVGGGGGTAGMRPHISLKEGQGKDRGVLRPRLWHSSLHNGPSSWKVLKSHCFFFTMKISLKFLMIVIVKLAHCKIWNYSRLYEIASEIPLPSQPTELTTLQSWQAILLDFSVSIIYIHTWMF